VPKPVVIQPTPLPAEGSQVIVVAVTSTPPPLQLATFKVPIGVAIALPANPQTVIAAKIHSLVCIFFLIILRFSFSLFAYCPSTMVDYH
jgi:hypothetical protein